VEVVIKGKIKPQVAVTQKMAIRASGKEQNIRLTAAEFRERLGKIHPKIMIWLKRLLKRIERNH